MVNVDTKLRVFQYKILNNILFVKKKCSLNFHLWRQLQEFFSAALNLPSILPQGAIFGFLDDALKHKLLLNHILLIFENYLYKARENKDLNFNIHKNYLTKLEILKLI